MRKSRMWVVFWLLTIFTTLLVPVARGSEEVIKSFKIPSLELGALNIGALIPNKLAIGLQFQLNF